MNTQRKLSALLLQPHQRPCKNSAYKKPSALPNLILSNDHEPVCRGSITIEQYVRLERPRLKEKNGCPRWKSQLQSLLWASKLSTPKQVWITKVNIKRPYGLNWRHIWWDGEYVGCSSFGKGQIQERGGPVKIYGIALRDHLTFYDLVWNCSWNLRKARERVPVREAVYQKRPKRWRMVVSSKIFVFEWVGVIVAGQGLNPRPSPPPRADARKPGPIIFFVTNDKRVMWSPQQSESKGRSRKAVEKRSVLMLWKKIRAWHSCMFFFFPEKLHRPKPRQLSKKEIKEMNLR